MFPGIKVKKQQRAPGQNSKEVRHRYVNAEEIVFILFFDVQNVYLHTSDNNKLKEIWDKGDISIYLAVILNPKIDIITSSEEMIPTKYAIRNFVT